MRVVVRLTHSLDAVTTVMYCVLNTFLTVISCTDYIFHLLFVLVNASLAYENTVKIDYIMKST